VFHLVVSFILVINLANTTKKLIMKKRHPLVL